MSNKEMTQLTVQNEGSLATTQTTSSNSDNEIVQICIKNLGPFGAIQPIPNNFNDLASITKDRVLRSSKLCDGSLSMVKRSVANNLISEGNAFLIPNKDVDPKGYAIAMEQAKRIRTVHEARKRKNEILSRGGYDEAIDTAQDFMNVVSTHAQSPSVIEQINKNNKKLVDSQEVK